MVLTKECSPRPRLGEVVAIYLKDPLFYDLIDRFTQNGGRDKFTPEDLRVLGGYVSSSPEIASLLSEVLNSAQLPQESRQHREPIMLSRPIIVLTTVAAIGSCVLSTSAFTQVPPPPPGIGGPPLGGLLLEALPVLALPVLALPLPAFPMAGLPVAGLPAAAISVAVLRPAMSAAACAAFREALVSAAGIHSIAAAAIAQVAIPDPTTAVGADMATMALLLLALLLVTPTVPPTVTRVTPTATRAAIGPSATRRARAGTSEWSMSANDVAGVHPAP